MAAPCPVSTALGEPASFCPDEVADLPLPVRRFFEWALVPGQPVIAAAECTQAGVFLLRAPATWRPFRATERFESAPPAFRWDARIRILPGLDVVVQDTFSGGGGSMTARVLGIVRLAKTAGTPEVAVGSLQRYLAEAVLFPTALLPREGVSWSWIDAHTAAASLTVGPTTASVQFRFGADGGVESVYVPDRPRAVGRGTVPTPWLGRWRDPVRRDGMQIPSHGEVEWQLSEGALPYWRAGIDRVEYRYR